MRTSFARTFGCMSVAALGALLVLGTGAAGADDDTQDDQGQYLSSGVLPAGDPAPYQQGSGEGKVNPDGSGAYANPNTGVGIITDGSGGVWVQPDPGGYTPPSPSE
jgi:hypothetical protein